MGISAIVQARMSSQRLPGKVLADLGGRPLLSYLLESLKMCSGLDSYLVATSVEEGDDPVAAFCGQQGVACFRGPLEDVAGRFAAAAQRCGCEAFVRVNGDSPFLDPRLIEWALGLFRKSPCDVVTNVHPRTFPKGQSVEVVRTASFARAYAEMRRPEHLEHVTKYFYDRASEFEIKNFSSSREYGGLQLSVDTGEDFACSLAMLREMRRPHWCYTYAELAEMKARLGFAEQGS